jgi:hypothetical protein
MSLLGAAVWLAAAPAGASWIFGAGLYTHDRATGERVVQFERPAPAFVPTDPTYQQSGYRHKRSSLRVGGSADYQHLVETWGEGENIRPYGEWLYPYRAGATPYGPWGNPQGPWTLPFDSWVNPYGSWNRYGYPYATPPYPAPYVYPPGGGAYPGGYPGPYPGGHPGGGAYPGGYPGPYPGGHPGPYPGGVAPHPGPVPPPAP